MTGFTAEQRARLAGLARRAEPVPCPACGSSMSRQDVEPPPDVAYVRRRVWLICPSCKRSASVDIRAGGPP